MLSGENENKIVEVGSMKAIRNLIAVSSLVMYFMHLNFVGSYVALVVESEPYVSINLNYQKTAANLNNPNVCMYDSLRILFIVCFELNLN